MNERQLAYCALVLHGALRRPSSKEEILILLAERPMCRMDLIYFLGTYANPNLRTLLQEGLVERRGYRLWKRCIFYVLTDAGRAAVEKITEPLKKYCVPDSEEFILEEAYHIHDSVLKKSTNYEKISRLKVRYGDDLLIAAFPHWRNRPAGRPKKAPLIPENHEEKKARPPKIRQPLIRRKQPKRARTSRPKHTRTSRPKRP